MSADKRVSALDFTERGALHDDLRVIAHAAETCMLSLDVATTTVGDLLTMYEQLWNHHPAFTVEVVGYAGQLLPPGTLGTLHTDLGDRPRERLDALPAYLSLTIREWLDALNALGDDPQWP